MTSFAGRLAVLVAVTATILESPAIAESNSSGFSYAVDSSGAAGAVNSTDRATSDNVGSSTAGPIDPLVRRADGMGGIEYAVTVMYRPHVSESVTETTEGPVRERTLAHQIGLALLFEHKVSKALSLQVAHGWSGGVALVEHLSPVVLDEQAAAVASSIPPASHTVYGMSWRPLSARRIEPAFELQVESAGGVALNLSLSSIADPAVLSARVGFIFEGGDQAIDLGFGAGFVANDRVSFGASASHRMAPGRALPPLTTMGVRVGYAIERYGTEMGVTASVYLKGGESWVGFGVYWQGEALSR